MRSPTAALLWEIWQLNRPMIAGIVGLTMAGRLLDSSDAVERGSAGMSSAVDLLWMASFLLLFGVFNYAEPGDARGVGRFPARLFILPVSTLRLVAIPVLTGVVSIELLYLAWMEPLARGGSASPAYVAVLLAASMVCYQAALWTLARLGATRMLVLGALAIAMFGIGVLPSFAPSPAPAWRSEIVLAAFVISLAIVAFLLALRHVRRVRCGDAHCAGMLDQLTAALTMAIPGRQRAFGSPAAAHFWFEWRCCGQALPMLVGGVLLLTMLPLSWLWREEASRTLPLLFAALATPVALAIPVGFGFGRPTFWSDDLAMPTFVAARPLADDDIVATKLKVAFVSVAVSWLLVLAFLGCWLSLWANLDGFQRSAVSLQTRPDLSNAMVTGVVVLGVMAGILLTWRCLVCRLWTGLSGNPRLFSASVISLVLLASVGAVVHAAGLAAWIVESPERVAIVVWFAVVAVGAKYGLAVYAWRHIAARYIRQYLLMWATGTACFVALAVLLCELVRVTMAVDVNQFRALAIVVALLAVPLGRVGLAPALLASNRHR